MTGRQDFLTALFIWREHENFSSGAGGTEPGGTEAEVRFYNVSQRSFDEVLQEHCIPHYLIENYKAPAAVLSNTPAPKWVVKLIACKTG